MIRYQRPVYNAAYWILRSADDASDIAQDVFLKVAERLDEYDSHHKFFSWIYRIAVNESLNLLRRNGHQEWLDDEIDIPGPDSANPESLATDAERTRHIQRALMDLSVNDRTVLDASGTFPTAATKRSRGILDLDEKTVKSRLFEARHRLRETLKDFRPG